MARQPAGAAPAIFDLKSATLTLVAVVLKTADVAALREELASRFADTPDLFDQEPVVIDVSALRESNAAINFPALMAALRRHGMVPVAVKGGSAAQTEAGLAAGLGEAPDSPAPPPRTEPLVRTVEVVKEVIKEVPVVREVEVVKEVIREVVKEAPGGSGAMPTMVIDRPLRSGQQVYAKGCDLVVLSAVNNGAEIIADGHIHVYAPLRGRAIAGARGKTDARIFTTCLEPELVAIAGIYRTTELPIPDEVLGKPAQIRLVGEKLVMEPLLP